MSKLTSGGVAAAVLAGALTAVLAPAQAQARSCFTLHDLALFDGYVVSDHFRYCDPPGGDHPLPSTIQRKSGTSWVDIATGSGGASYHCAGTSTRTYRLKEKTSKTITVACS